MCASPTPKPITPTLIFLIINLYTYMIVVIIEIKLLNKFF